jgi:hypothetical protein
LTDKQTDKQTDRLTDRQTDRQTDKQTDRQTEASRQAFIMQKGRQTRNTQMLITYLIFQHDSKGRDREKRVKGQR